MKRPNTGTPTNSWCLLSNRFCPETLSVRSFERGTRTVTFASTRVYVSTVPLYTPDATGNPATYRPRSSQPYGCGVLLLYRSASVALFAGAFKVTSDRPP